MATIITTLSTKVDKDSGLSEILIRLFSGKRINLRAKSNIFVNAAHWDANKQAIVIPRFRLMTAEQKKVIAELQEKSVKLNDLKLYIMNDFNDFDDGRSKLPQDWLKNTISNFYELPNEVEEEPAIAPEPVITKPTKPIKPIIPKVKLLEVKKSPAQQPAAPSSSFFSVFSDFIAKNEVSENRKRHYRVVYRALQRYEAYKKIQLSFDTITGETLKDFERYLGEEHELYAAKKLNTILKMYPESREIHQRGSNYIKDMMGKLRTFCRYASGKVKEMPVDVPYFTTNPFDTYSIGTQTPLGTPYFLTIEERNQLYHTELASERLSRQRDIFIFQCLIGCRVGDLMRLTWDNVVGDELHYIPSKTCKNNPKTIIIPLHEIALEIINKYKVPGRKTLLPFVAQQQYNEDIKTMLTLAGITRKVVIIDPKTDKEVIRNINDIASSHMARRTFVGNLYNKVKDPNLIGSLSGHVNGSKAFARYRAIDMNVKKELVSMLD